MNRCERCGSENPTMAAQAGECTRCGGHMITDIIASGPGSHSADLAEMRTQTARAECAELRLAASIEREAKMGAAWAKAQFERAAVERERDEARAKRDELAKVYDEDTEFNHEVEVAFSAFDARHGSACRGTDEYDRLYALIVEGFAPTSPAKEHCPRRLMGEHQEPHAPCDTGDHSKDGNQCDGCRSGRPVDERGYHRMGDGEYPDYMACQRAKYGSLDTRKEPK